MASGRSTHARPAGRRRVAGQRAHPAVPPTAAAAPEPATDETDRPAQSTVDDVGAEPAIEAVPATEEDHFHVIAPLEAGDGDLPADDPDVAKTARTRLDRLPGWLPVLSCVLIVVFLATSAVLGWRLYEGHAREVSRNDVLRIVPSYAAKIFSFDYRHLDQDAKGAHPLLVGGYRQDYDKSMQRRSADYTKYHYIVKSTVSSAGVSDASADQVRVVAFIDQSVTAGVPKSATAQEQTRLALTFQKHDGTWLLAKVAAL